MTKFEYINNNLLKPQGIKDQIKLGILPPSVLKHYSIYSRYDYYRKLSNKVSKAIFYTSEDFNITEYWVYVIKKAMEAEI